MVVIAVITAAVVAEISAARDKLRATTTSKISILFAVTVRTKLVRVLDCCLCTFTTEDC